MLFRGAMVSHASSNAAISQLNSFSHSWRKRVSRHHLPQVIAKTDSTGNVFWICKAPSRSCEKTLRTSDGTAMQSQCYNCWNGLHTCSQVTVLVPCYGSRASHKNNEVLPISRSATGWPLSPSIRKVH